ncbi:hypothetical protein M432DRAFT_645900 [Thermoascus aurantiacus ATCC 26904]
MSDNEYLILLRDLAPHESDGPDDSQEWNLFDSYLNGGEDSLNNPHDLSDMLNDWENDVVLATTDEDKLDAAGKDAKLKLGEKAIRALKRLSTIPLPLPQISYFF